MTGQTVATEPNRDRRWRERASLGVFVLVFAPLLVAVRLLTHFLGWIEWDRRLPRLQSLLGIRRRVLYLEVFFPEASGYVYRVANWARVLERAGFATHIRHPLGARVSGQLLSGGWTGIFYALYLLRRLPQCLAAPFYNCVVVRRELLLYDDYGDLFLERLLLALNPRSILDFDDDISAAKQEPRPISRTGRLLRESSTKFGESLRLYPRFIAGSAYLKQLAIDHRGGSPPVDIEIIPTCVDYDDLPAKDYSQDAPVMTFGWIGTVGNLPHLERIIPDLDTLAREFPLRLVVISGRDVAVKAGFPIENRPWSLETQISDLMSIDIGLMPLRDTRVEHGKCGFKLIQYMGLGIVGLASAVTINREIVEDGVDGFLVEPNSSWLEALSRVVARRRDFAAIGEAARGTVRRRYSFEAHSQRYVEFIARACDAADHRLAVVA